MNPHFTPWYRPAFPLINIVDGREASYSGGLTVREYYAAKALAGILASSQLPQVYGSATVPATVAELCFSLADAMCEESRKDRKQP